MMQNLGSRLASTASEIWGWDCMAADTWGLRFKAFFLLSILSTLINGCTLYDLKKEIAEYETKYGLVGEVVDYSSYKGTVIVVLYSEKEGQKNIVEYTLPEDTGHFSFLVTRGTYYLAAFEDINDNYVCDENEPAGYFGAPERIVVPSDSKYIIDLDIRLSSSNRFPADFPANLDSEEFEGQPLPNLGISPPLTIKYFRRKTARSDTGSRSLF